LDGVLGVLEQQVHFLIYGDYMTQEEKDLLLQEMQRQHILHGGGLGRPMVDGSMRLKMSLPPFDTGTASGTTGGMGTYGGGTPQPMNLGQGTGNPRMFPPQPMRPQMPPQVPQQVPQVPTGLPNMNRRNDPLTNALTQTVMPTAKQQQRPVSSGQLNQIKVMPPIETVRPFGDITNIPFSSGQLSQNGVPLNDLTGMPIVPTQNNQTDPSYIPDDFWAMKKNNNSDDIAGGVLSLVNQNNQKRQVPQDRGMFGMTGFFGDLFNDPRRMAMLSGGLTALDPSSYYDKEGFGSPWTGLRSGLGGAQAGYKSVIDRRKAEADTALAKAKTAAEGQSSQKFKSAQIGDATFMYSDADIQKRRNELMADGKIGWREATNKAIMETGTRIEKGIAPKSMYDIRVNFDKGQSHLENIDNLLNMAEDSFNTGAVGFGKRGYDKFRGFFSMEGDTTEATQLVTGINRIISQNWKELVGGGQLTPRDIEFIKSVVKTPESLGTTAAEVRSSLTELRKILKKAQTNRAKTLGIKDYDPTQRISPNLGSVGGTAKSFIDSISPR